MSTALKRHTYMWYSMKAAVMNNKKKEVKRLRMDFFNVTINSSFGDHLLRLSRHAVRRYRWVHHHLVRYVYHGILCNLSRDYTSLLPLYISLEHFILSTHACRYCHRNLGFNYSDTLMLPHSLKIVQWCLHIW